jgi:4-hydroxybenzoate polyprenyltransferase
MGKLEIGRMVFVQVTTNKYLLSYDFEPPFSLLSLATIYTETTPLYITYDHRFKRTGHPVRSAIHKLEIGRLVVGWVTTSEYLLLYVFFAFFFLFLSLSRHLLGSGYGPDASYGGRS